MSNVHRKAALTAVLGAVLARTPAAASTLGMTVIFTSHSELQSLDTGRLPASVFEVPAGYTRS